MQPGDVLSDYTLDPYDPRTDPTGKLRSVNVLFESFAIAGVEREGRRVVEALREGFGPFRTVFGVKFHAPDHVAGWELYFYDPRREHADVDIDRIARILRPALHVDARPPRA